MSSVGDGEAHAALLRAAVVFHCIIASRKPILLNGQRKMHKASTNALRVDN